MTTRRILWGLIGVLSVLVLVGSSAVAWLLLRPKAAPIQLVVTSDDDRMRLLDANGKERVLDSKINAQQYRFPAATRDGRKLAYVVADGDTMRVMRLDVVSGERSELYHSAMRQPLDLAWSPDGHYVIFLAAGANGLATYIVPDDGSQAAQLVANGKTTYFAWSHDSKSLLLHVNGHMVQGGHVDVYDTDKQQATPLLNNPGFFQAPAWSVDSTALFYVAQPPFPSNPPRGTDVQSDIMRVTASGKEPKVLTSEKQADVRMVRAPTSDQIAYIALHEDAAGNTNWSALKLVDGNTGESHIISPPDAQVAAFFWSPDGKRIAYLTYKGDFAPDSERTWHTVDTSTGAVKDLATFTPSRAFAALQIFFDAYFFSLNPWSPDGSRLVYGAEDGVYVLDLAKAQPARVAEGTMGVWVGGR